MINTVDDFMKRFGSQGTVNDEEAGQLHDLFVSNRPEHSQFDNRTYQNAAAEYLGKLPDDQFQNAARSAVAQVPQQERQDLLGGLLGALPGGSAGGLGGIASMIVLSLSAPTQINEAQSTRCS